MKLRNLDKKKALYEGALALNTVRISNILLLQVLVRLVIVVKVPLSGTVRILFVPNFTITYFTNATS